MATIDPLLEQTTPAIRLAFEACRGAAPSDDLIGYAIASDDSAMTFVPMAASSAGITAFADGTPDDFVFNPEHWNIQEGLEHLESVQAEIDALYAAGTQEDDPGWHDRHRNRVFELMVTTLERLRDEGGLEGPAHGDDIFLIAWVVDSDVPRERAGGWSERLNRPARHRQFLAWLAATDYWGPPPDRRPAKKAPAKAARKRPPRPR